MLSDSEQRRLLEIEALLSGEDPVFAQRFTHVEDLRRRARRRMIAVVLCAASLIATVVALVTTIVPIAVIGICGVGAAGCVWTWRPVGVPQRLTMSAEPPSAGRGDTASASGL